MILSLAIAAELADKCAPHVAKATLLSVAYHESHLDTLAISDNTTRRRFHPRSRLEAVQTAQALIAGGHSIDMGIGQINSRTAPSLGLTVFGAFDACQNMAAAGAMMERSYRKIAGASAQRSLATMLSIYNTGNPSRGFGNGYVGRVYRAAATIVPQLGRMTRVAVNLASIDPILSTGPILGAPVSGAPPAAVRVPATDEAERPAPPPPWVAFGNPVNVMVFGTIPAAAAPLDRKETSQ